MAAATQQRQMETVIKDRESALATAESGFSPISLPVSKVLRIITRARLSEIAAIATTSSSPILSRAAVASQVTSSGQLSRASSTPLRKAQKPSSKVIPKKISSCESRNSCVIGKVARAATDV